jgi:hypothetical protein
MGFSTNRKASARDCVPGFGLGAQLPLNKIISILVLGKTGLMQSK